VDLGAPDHDALVVLIDHVHVVVRVHLLRRRLAPVTLDVGDGAAEVQVVLPQVLQVSARPLQVLRLPHLLGRRHDGVHGVGADVFAERQPAGQADGLADHLEALLQVLRCVRWYEVAAYRLAGLGMRRHEEVAHRRVVRMGKHEVAGGRLRADLENGVRCHVLNQLAVNEDATTVPQAFSKLLG
jgi:hypothetical protein